MRTPEDLAAGITKEYADVIPLADQYSIEQAICSVIRAERTRLSALEEVAAASYGLVEAMTTYGDLKKWQEAKEVLDNALKKLRNAGRLDDGGGK